MIPSSDQVLKLYGLGTFQFLISGSYFYYDEPGHTLDQIYPIEFAITVGTSTPDYVSGTTFPVTQRRVWSDALTYETGYGRLIHFPFGGLKFNALFASTFVASFDPNQTRAGGGTQDPAHFGYGIRVKNRLALGNDNFIINPDGSTDSGVNLDDVAFGANWFHILDPNSIYPFVTQSNPPPPPLPNQTVVFQGVDNKYPKQQATNPDYQHRGQRRGFILRCVLYRERAFL